MSIKNNDLIIIIILILIVIAYLACLQTDSFVDNTTNIDSVYNESFVNTTTNIDNIYNDLLFKFFLKNRPILFCVADKKNENALYNLVNQKSYGYISGNTTLTTRSNTTLPYINGGVNTRIVFPTILPLNHTLVGITKYNGSVRGRILDAHPNSLYGHSSGNAGVVHINRWVTDPAKPILSDPLKPLVTCVRVRNDNKTGDTQRINDVILNNIPVGGYNNNYPEIKQGSQLLINGIRNEPSDFSFSLICVFSTFLTDEDMLFISNIFNQVLQNPILLDNIENIIMQITNVIASQNINK